MCRKIIRKSMILEPRGSRNRSQVDSRTLPGGVCKVPPRSFVLSLLATVARFWVPFGVQLGAKRDPRAPKSDPRASTTGSQSHQLLIKHRRKRVRESVLKVIGLRGGKPKVDASEMLLRCLPDASQMPPPVCFLPDSFMIPLPPPLCILHDSSSVMGLFL